MITGGEKMENINEIKNSDKGFKTSSKDYFYKAKLVLCVIGILVGLLLLINTIAGDDFFFGIGIFGYGLSLQDCQFGADFYTEIYTAVSRVNENIGILSEAVEAVGKTIAVVLGFGFTLGFGMKLLNIIGEHKKIMNGEKNE